ncbi:MAG: YceI family protein [Chloroflexi bacterium]|nr:YceI family protein [Chloroflexota bacterium]
MAWQIDSAHSHIQFSVRHMMLAKVRGEFDKFSGTIHLDETNPAASTADVQIEAASINTREAQRDGHLKSPDFFDAEKYPTLNFKSKRVDVKDDTHAVIIGDLTIRDVTKEVAVNVEYMGQSKTPFGTTNAGFEATTKINRKDFGLTWNAVLETGGVAVGDEITVNIDLELIKQPDAAPVSA